MQNQRSKSRETTRVDVFRWFLEFMKWLGIFRNLWWLGQQTAKYVSMALRKLASILYAEHIYDMWTLNYVPKPEGMPLGLGITSNLPLIFQAKYLYHELLKNKTKEGKVLAIQSKGYWKLIRFLTY